VPGAAVLFAVAITAALLLHAPAGSSALALAQAGVPVAAVDVATVAERAPYGEIVDVPWRRGVQRVVIHSGGI